MRVINEVRNTTILHQWNYEPKAPEGKSPRKYRSEIHDVLRTPGIVVAVVVVG